MIDSSVKLISVTHVPTNCGTINDVESIGDIARKHNILYLVDACQSVGQMPVDVELIKCDFLSATSRKYLRGPRGIGFLYVRKSCMEKYQLHPPMIDLFGATLNVLSSSGYTLRPDARRFENWESNYAAKLGFGAAVDYALALGLNRIKERIDELASTLRDRLAAVDGVALHAISTAQCGIVSFSLKHIEAKEVMKILREGKKINVSVSSPSSTLIDATKHGLPDLIRASIHYYNDEGEIDVFVAAIAQLLSR
jgi:selenocysteine lyase/cysteine desulfurase